MCSVDPDAVVLRTAIAMTAAYSGTPVAALGALGRLMASRTVASVWEELFEIALAEVGPANPELFVELVELYTRVASPMDAVPGGWTSVDLVHLYTAVSAIARSYKSQASQMAIVWALATADRAALYLRPLALAVDHLPAESRLLLRAFADLPQIHRDVAAAHLAMLPLISPHVVDEFFRACNIDAAAADTRKTSVLGALRSITRLFSKCRPLAMFTAFHLATRGLATGAPASFRWPEGRSQVAENVAYAVSSLVVTPAYFSSTGPLRVEHGFDARRFDEFRAIWARAY
jgi:hypothetical protein